jgi:hypothetical protein
MRSLMIVLFKPQVKIKLKRFDIPVNLLSECHLIKFLQHGFVKPFTDAVGLRQSGLGLGVFDIVNAG